MAVPPRGDSHHFFEFRERQDFYSPRTAPIIAWIFSSGVPA